MDFIFNQRCFFLKCLKFKTPDLQINSKVRKFDQFVRYLHRNKDSRTITPKAKQRTLAPEFVAIDNDVGFRKLIKPLIFTACFSGCCFVGATIWQYENMRKRSTGALEYSVYSLYSPTYKRGEIRRKFNLWWNRQTEGQKVASIIILSNVFVFLLWKVPHMQPFMVRYFCSSPSMKSVCLPMFLSTFSHYSFLHLATNMYVLYSFSSSSVALFGKEQFLAVYFSAGVISSFISYIYKIATCRMGVSLGASGALMSILSSSCIQYPDAQLAVIFFPFLTVSAGMAIKLVMAVDTAGIIAGWRFLDHAAHLGGALFGIGYLLYGNKYIWGNREKLMHWWHDLREKR